MTCTSDTDQQLTLRRGDTRTFVSTIKNNGVVFDLTGYTAKLTVKVSRKDPDADAIIGPLTGTITSPTTGVVEFYIDSDTSDVDEGTYYYDVEITNGTYLYTPIQTTIKVVLDVTDNGATTAEEVLTISEDELRTFLQFDRNDYPNRQDMRFFIKYAMKKIALDIDTSNENILFIATLLLSKSIVLRGLATKAVSKGYIQVNAEGRTITKAYQEFVLEAENTEQEYKAFLLSVGRREATSTNFMDNSTIIDSWTRSDIIAIMNGTSNALDVQSTTLRNYFGSLRGSY